MNKEKEIKYTAPSESEYIFPEADGFFSFKTKNYHASIKFYIEGDNLLIPLIDNRVIKIPATALMHGKIEDDSLSNLESK